MYKQESGMNYTMRESEISSKVHFKNKRNTEYVSRNDPFQSTTHTPYRWKNKGTKLLPHLSLTRIKMMQKEPIFN